MSQQLNKREKRVRRERYHKRRKAAARKPESAKEAKAS